VSGGIGDGRPGFADSLLEILRGVGEFDRRCSA
jgi:hypothetical protein